jgi:hypothetical protein
MWRAFGVVRESARRLEHRHNLTGWLMSQTLDVSVRPFKVNAIRNSLAHILMFMTCSLHHLKSPKLITIALSNCSLRTYDGLTYGYGGA